jgi:transposase
VAGNVVIGMGPHKRSATIEVMSSDESVLDGGRYATDAVGYRSIFTYAKQWPARTWAIEGSNGAGRHIAMRLVADGETVVDVPGETVGSGAGVVSGQGRKTEKDAVLIARLRAQLRCYVPEPVDEMWGRLRHLGARRELLIVEMVSQIQQMRALLECVWPAALDTAKQPFRSKTWAAAMSVICERDGDLDRTRRLGRARFEQAVRREILKRGGQKPSLRIAGKLFAALTDPTGVTAHRPGALERVAFLLADWQSASVKLADTEHRMVSVLDQLDLTTLATSIHGLSAVGAAAILAETGDPNRFASARALVKHAGLAPREKLSGTFVGRTKLTGAGRPGLRLAAWRAVWGTQRGNTVYPARHRHLTSREQNKLTATQAQTVIAAAILRQLHAVTTTGRAWDPDIATHGTGHRKQVPIAA